MAYKDTWTDAFGLVAFLRMAAYARLARDVSMTKNFDDQLVLARMGRDFIEAIDQMTGRLAEKNLSLSQITQPYVGALDDMEKRTRPADWWERCIKSYVMVGILGDLETVVGAGLPEEYQDLPGAAGKIGHAQWIRDRIGEEVSADNTLSARLSMWGRRVAGETMAAIQHILVQHPDLLADGQTPAEVQEKISAAHARRMEALELAS